MKITEKHFRTGSTCPPQEPGSLRLYSMKYCPFAQRTRLVIAHKNIKHELVNIHLQYKPEWFLEKAPLGLVPVLEQGDKIVYESAICNEYLDEIYPQNKLTPEDPFEKAQMKMLMERFGKTAGLYFGVTRHRDQLAEYLPKFYATLQPFEDALAGTFFGGSKLNMLDLHMWPFFERIPFARSEYKIEMLPSEKFPRLTAWMAAMAATETCQRGNTDFKYFGQVMAAYADGSDRPYDLGIED